MSTLAQVEERKQEKVDFKRILMAADFSAASDRALAHALAIARRFGAEISLVHAIPPGHVSRSRWIRYRENWIASNFKPRGRCSGLSWKWNSEILRIAS